MKIILACLLAAAAFACARTQAATPVNLQVCTVTPGGGGLIGCPAASVTFAAVTPTSLVRSQVNGVQGWRAYANLTPADQVVSQDGAWHALSTLTVATTTPIPPVTTPPVVTPPVPPPKDTWVAMQWTCSMANNVATCTAPLP